MFTWFLSLLEEPEPIKARNHPEERVPYTQKCSQSRTVPEFLLMLLSEGQMEKGLQCDFQELRFVRREDPSLKSFSQCLALSFLELLPNNVIGMRNKHQTPLSTSCPHLPPFLAWLSLSFFFSPRRFPNLKSRSNRAQSPGELRSLNPEVKHCQPRSGSSIRGDTNPERLKKPQKNPWRQRWQRSFPRKLGLYSLYRGLGRERSERGDSGRH